MRIIAGKHKGRTIAAPPGRDTRPTTDRVRESVMSSLFSMLDGFAGTRVLDAFAGSGAMGFEALSRGAASCVMNDEAPASRATIERNRETLGYAPTVAKVSGTDILKRGLPAAGGPFDLVFLDPPYKTEAADVLALVRRAFAAGVLDERAVVVYEHGLSLSDELAASQGLRIRAQKRYGKTHVTYLSTAVAE